MRKRALALLFTLHPVQTEAVNVVSFREDLISLFFFLLSFICYISFTKPVKRKAWFYAFSLFFFFLAVFTKEMALTLPFILMVYDYYFNNRKTIGKFISGAVRSAGYLGYYALILVFFIHRIFLLKPVGYVMDGSVNIFVGYPGGNVFTAALTMIKALVYYLKLLVMPLVLSADHGFPACSSLNPGVLVSIVILALVIVFAVRMNRRSKEISFSIVYFFIALIPVSNIAPIGEVVAERYLYYSSIGFCLFTGLICMKLLRLENTGFRFSKELLLIIIIVILGFYSGRTYLRNIDYRNELTFWGRTLEAFPDSLRALIGRGAAYGKEGLYDRAIEDYSRVIEINPNVKKAYNNRGNAYARKGLYDKAVSDFNMALEINPDYPRAYNNRGIVHTGRGLFDKAVTDLSRAIELNPLFANAYVNRATAYTGKGEYDKALADLNRAIELSGECPEAYNNRGRVYLKKGFTKDAVRDFNRAVEIDPGNPKFYRNRGAAYKIMGKHVLARKDRKKAMLLLGE